MRPKHFYLEKTTILVVYIFMSTSLHRYHTEFLDADIFRLVYSRGINILKLKVGALI